MTGLASGIDCSAQSSADNGSARRSVCARVRAYCAASAAEATVQIQSNAVSVTAVLKAAPRGIIPDATQLRVTLYAGQPWLDLEWSITNKTPDPWPEGGWLCFPLRANKPSLV